MRAKKILKQLLVQSGIYYKINDFRFRNSPTGGLREVAQKKFYSNFMGREDIVFDVGANVGQRSQVFSKLAKKVVAVEPQSQCVRHLESRFKFVRNVLIEQIALSDSEGEEEIYESDSHTISSMSLQFINTVKQGRFAEHKWSQPVRVETKTLDQLIVKHGLPTFIKIDVEGYEFNVLSGLNQKVPGVSFEFTPEFVSEAEKCITRLNEISNSYRYNYCLGEELSFKLSGHASYSTFLHTILPQMAKQSVFGDIYAICHPESMGNCMGLR